MRLTVVASGLALTAALVIGCGGSASTTPDGGGGGASAPASAQSGGGGGGGGASLPDGFDGSLVPPNSTVILTTGVAGARSVIFHSTDSYDSLKGFYEAAAARNGGEAFKTEVEGSLSLGFGSQGNGTGTLISVVPSSEGGFDVNVTTGLGS